MTRTNLANDLYYIQLKIEALDDLISEHVNEFPRMYDAMINLLQALEDDRETVE